MGRLPGSKNKILKNAVSSDEISIKGNKRSYVRHHCKKSSSGQEEQPSTSNQKPKLVFSLLEKLTKEVQTLSMEVVEFERRAQDRYRSLIDEHFNLRKQVTGLSSRIAEISEKINKLHAEGIMAEKSILYGTKMANPLMRELERNINGTFDETDDEEKRDEAVGAKDSTIDTNELNNKPRKRRAAANKREGDYANMLKQNISFHEPKKSVADTPKPREKKAKFLKKESDDGTDSENSNADSKEGTEISPWKMYKHIQIKPRPTDLPKPKIARSGGGRNVHFTDEWKRYATTVYPIDPSRYWNLPQAQYDLLIPDSDLEIYAKNPDKTEKEHFIRSIYDWFRSQHRIAQLRVVLNECNSAIDFNDLWDVYVKEMKRRGWPVYGKRLRKAALVTTSFQVIHSKLQNNFDLNHGLFANYLETFWILFCLINKH
ncbi:50S ribosomal protein [Dirofilaria immitis]